MNDRKGALVPELVNLFPILFVIVGAVIAVVIVVIVVQAVANARRLRQGGHDPLTLQADLANRLLDSEALSPDKSTEQRLAELDRLQQAQIITAAEYRTARARVLTDH